MEILYTQDKSLTNRYPRKKVEYCYIKCKIENTGKQIVAILDSGAYYSHIEAGYSNGLLMTNSPTEISTRDYDGKVNIHTHKCKAIISIPTLTGTSLMIEQVFIVDHALNLNNTQMLIGNDFINNMDNVSINKETIIINSNSINFEIRKYAEV